MRRLLVVLPVVLVGLVGCAEYNDDKRGRGDAPVGTYDDSEVLILNMPDQFMNVAFKCMGVNGIYTHTRAASPVVVPNDPMCRGDG